ncbi:sensor histidine kinase [Maledivibacter halophilus]|uniref:histidine kinase n=1 Tax=Maledivibacter halophilus TaxID=36842 RepID=A0A1T5M4R1_9FIRM|nr:GHKL domain-containing protein [Maledivibacter halophilus]SKC83222.1 two-component system, CitB family, cit operon sensor histidine kinase CitA [Maledivibacter halophilus]
MMKKMMINRKTYILIIILILLQSLSIALITNQSILSVMNYDRKILYGYPNTLGLFINILGISVVIWVFYIVKLVEKEQDANRKLNHSTEVIEALRGQKHDFHNHLNVITGLIQLGKPSKAVNYIQKVSGETTKMFSISNIGNTEVAAILYRKCAIAESKGIVVDLDVGCSLDNIVISSVDMCTILFNLIDNAIYELEQCREDDKILTIDITQQGNECIFVIGNSYPVLSPELYDKVFSKGFSTKEGESHGYGLNNVRNIVKRNKGEITVESYEGVGTIFTVFLPKR